MNEARLEAIRACLIETMDPEMLEIEDESHLHAGHAGARDGRGHFRVMIVSGAFDGKSRLARHRLIYQALGKLMETEIHALSIQAFTPAEI